jgi:hypothetical protein
MCEFYSVGEVLKFLQHKGYIKVDNYEHVLVRLENLVFAELLVSTFYESILTKKMPLSLCMP